MHNVKPKKQMTLEWLCFFLVENVTTEFTNKVSYNASSQMQRPCGGWTFPRECLQVCKKQIVSLSTQPCHNERSRNDLPHNTHVAVYALAFGEVLAPASNTRMTNSTRNWPTRNFDSCGFVTLQRHHKRFHEIPSFDLLRIVMEANL
jgi:hypothetical protein